MTRKDDSNDGKRPDRSVGGRREEAAAEGPLMRSEVVGREEARQERLVTMRRHPTRYDVSLWDRRRRRDGEDVLVDTKAVGNEQQRRLVTMRRCPYQSDVHVFTMRLRACIDYRNR